MRFFRFTSILILLVLSLTIVGCEKRSEIDIQVLTNGMDADVPTGPEITIGEEVVWTYVVTNTGQTSLTDVKVTDDSGVVPSYASGDDGDSVMQTGEVWHYEAMGIAESGQQSNVGTAEGWYGTTKVQDTDPSNYLGVGNLGISIRKLINDEDVEASPGPEITIGESVTWTYLVENTGDASLTDIYVSDDQGLTPLYVSGDNGNLILQEGEIWRYEATDSAVEGQYTNVGYVEGWYTGTKVSDSDASYYLGIRKTWSFDFTTAADLDGWFLDTYSADSTVRSKVKPRIDVREIEVSGIVADTGYTLTSDGLSLNYNGVSSPFAFTGDFTMFVEFSLIVDGINDVNFECYPADAQAWIPDNFIYSFFHYIGNAGLEEWYVDDTGPLNYLEIVYETGTVPELNRNGINTWKVVKNGNSFETWINSYMIASFNATFCQSSKYYLTLYSELSGGTIYFRNVKIDYNGEMI